MPPPTLMPPPTYARIPHEKQLQVYFYPYYKPLEELEEARPRPRGFVLIHQWAPRAAMAWVVRADMEEATGRHRAHLGFPLSENYYRIATRRHHPCGISNRLRFPRLRPYR